MSGDDLATPCNPQATNIENNSAVLLPAQPRKVLATLDGLVWPRSERTLSFSLVGGQGGKMFAHCNSAKRLRMFLRTASSRTASTNGPALALACGLLAGCAAPGAGPSPLADDPNAAPKVDPAVKQTAGVGLETKAVATDPVSLQRRRQAIADMIEGRLAYVSRWGEGGAAKLTETRFAGPFEFSYKYPFMDRVTETVYCASANAHFPYWPFPYPYEAVIRAEKVDSGSERLKSEIWERETPRECRAAPYGAFPELDQARAKRRASLGLPD